MALRRIVCESLSIDTVFINDGLCLHDEAKVVENDASCRALT